MISEMRKRSYPGSMPSVERVLPNAGAVLRRVVSYRSDDLKIYGLLMQPLGQRPKPGWPIIVLNHGYMPPAAYQTTTGYAYQEAIARAGYLVFKPDFRGHGQSDGTASDAYSTPDYATDALNAVSSLQQLPEADPARVGMWGHSMGGHITLRAMAVDRRITAGVIWAGVVASYPMLLTQWRRAPQAEMPVALALWRDQLIRDYGDIGANPAFWSAISPSHFVEQAGPIQLHHGTRDTVVPLDFSTALAAKLAATGTPHEYYTYRNDDHNLSRNTGVAIQRSLAWLATHV